MIALYTDKTELKTDIRLQTEDIIDNLTQQIDTAQEYMADVRENISSMSQELEGTMKQVDELYEMLERLQEL
jgi:archaellum component FlaC